MPSQTNEQAFEYLIEKALVGSTVEERKAAGNEDIDAFLESSEKEVVKSKYSTNNFQKN